jgi:hypothetical protein
LDSARQFNLFEKHLEGIPEHLILSYLLEKNPKDPGMKIFNCARKIVEERLIRDAGYDLRDGTWSEQTPPSFAEHNESGRIILVAVPLMKGERGECNEKSSRWLAGACGLVVLHKIAPALVLRKSGMDLEIKVFTTKHNSDLGKLVERGIMEEYFQCVVDGFDDNKKPVERCTGLVKIERSENSFGWSRVPRFMHKSSTTWIPSNSARKTLGRIVDPNSLVAIAKAHKQGAEACGSHLMKVANNLGARAFGRLRIKSTGFTSKIPIPSKVSTIFYNFLHQTDNSAALSSHPGTHRWFCLLHPRHIRKAGHSASRKIRSMVGDPRKGVKRCEHGLAATIRTYHK